MLYIMLFAIFILLLSVKTPIAVAFALVGALGLFIKDFALVVVIRQAYQGVDTYSLMALPFFAFAGNIMSKGGITKNLVEFADYLVGWIKGSIGHINIVGSILFAGISGAAVSDVAALGTMLIPAMEEAGYDKSYSSALTAASAMIGPVIPPSLSMVVFGGTMNMSIGTLFAAGILPGVFLGIVQMIINYVIVSKRGYEKDKFKLRENRKSSSKITDYFSGFLPVFKNSIIGLIMFLIIFGGILGGIFTATEAAAVAAVYALFATYFFIGSMSIKDIWETLVNSASLTGMLMVIIAGGSIVSHFLVLEGLPAMIAEILMGFTETDWVFLLITAGFLVLVGMFMSLMPSIIILAPVLTPVAIEFGVNPYHFGLFFVFSLNTALITPPVGSVLYLVAGIGDTTFEKVAKEILPFYISFLVVILLIVFFEPITLYVPKIFGLL